MLHLLMIVISEPSSLVGSVVRYLLTLQNTRIISPASIDSQWLGKIALAYRIGDMR